ncbi:MAG: hypothetical protein H7X99_08415 [Saprospiraceae bacterium]|nr:hypothetical protein [Saprospiraceae bacterium]
MLNNIFILTGPVQSGKTTMLMDFMTGKGHAGGFLCPDIGGKRFYLPLNERILIPFQVDENYSGVKVAVGKFTFSASVFDKARSMLDGYQPNSNEWFILDEIGKLEVSGLGLEPSLTKFINNFKNQQADHTKLIIVVRDYLLKEVVEKYQIQDRTILKEITGSSLSFIEHPGLKD